MRRIAIIPARGGSKRIPRKNIKLFLGKPILAYSIEAAFESGLFDEVMVSTEDEEIARIAMEFGAKVPFFRTTENSNDYATLADVVDEVLAEYDNKFTFGCCILPTAPLIQIKNLQKAFNLLSEGNFHSIRPVVRFSYPVQRAVRLSDDGSVNWLYPEFATHRSQDLIEAYHDAGQFYWFYCQHGMRSSLKGAIIIDDFEAQDIDTYADWEIAELKYRYLFS